MFGQLRLWPLLMLLLSHTAIAQTVPLPNPGGAWSNPTQWLQQAINFANGPYAIAVSVLIFIAIFVGWILAPREGFLAQALRAFAVLLCIGNAAFFVTALRFA